MDWAVRRSHEPIVQLLKRFEKDGTLPARPSREQYEALNVAKDFVDAYGSENPDVVRRIVARFQIWRLSHVEQLRSQVRRRLGIGQRTKEEHRELTLDQAQSRVARMHGFESWPQLLTQCAGA